jgi:hypothetical protein
VRIQERIAAKPSRFDDVRDRVTTDFVSAKRREANELGYQRLRERYSIVVEQTPNASLAAMQSRVEKRRVDRPEEANRRLHAPGFRVMACGLDRNDGAKSFRHSRVGENPGADSRDLRILFLSNIMRLSTFLLLLLPATVFAHESRPAYLEVTEHTSNDYEVTWRRPALGDQVIALSPCFPSNYLDSTPHSAYAMPGAVLERWEITCRESDLVGQSIMIEGLSRTITDVLVRISLRAGVSEIHIARAHTPSVVVHGVPTSLAVAGKLLGLRSRTYLEWS